MPLPQAALEMLLADDSEPIAPKRGDEIFDGTDYPRTWDGFIGQAEVKEQLEVQAASAKARGARMEHTLIASPVQGVGKTTLATLATATAGVGFLQTTGPLDVHEAERLMMPMQDHDVLFIDEAHKLVDGNRNRADWLLPWMTEGSLYTSRGAIKTPDITLICATTDVGKLPATLVSRFMNVPELVAYIPAEGAQIAYQLSGRMDIPVPIEACVDITMAADHNPRMMRRILTKVRDLGISYPETHPNLPKAFKWSGVSVDGLATTAREMLVLLLMASDHTSAIDTLRAQLGEPGPIRLHEQALLQRGLITITGRGRQLTDAGVRRARSEVDTLR